MATFPYFSPQNLVPVAITGTTLFSNPISSLSINDAPPQVKQIASIQNIQDPILISKATLTHTPVSTISTVILSQGKIPLVVQRQQGQGTLYYLAFDPTLRTAHQLERYAYLLAELASTHIG